MSGASACTSPASSSAVRWPLEANRARRRRRRDDVTRPPCWRTRSRASSSVPASACRTGSVGERRLTASMVPATAAGQRRMSPSSTLLRISRINPTVPTRATSTGGMGGWRWRRTAAAARAHGADRREWARVGGMATVVDRAQRRRLGALGDGGRASLPRLADEAVRLRDRGARLHAGHAPRVRCRPHRRHRQHHPQAGRARASARWASGSSSPWGTRASCCCSRVAAQLRDPGAEPPGQPPVLGPALGDQHCRHLDLGHVPLPHRAGEPVRPRLDRQAVPADAIRSITTRPSSNDSSTSAG